VVKREFIAASAATVMAVIGATGCSHDAAGTGTSTPPAVAGGHFVGHWQRHASTMDITPTTVTMFLGLGNGPCSEDPRAACAETDTLAVESSGDTQLTLSVTAVSYGLANGQTAGDTPPNATSTAVGDAVRLSWQAPGLLEEVRKAGSYYWCGDGVSQSDEARCGA
jgi:hypothetical protein